MSIDIKMLSEKDLQLKIDNIKAEREKTADALKRYEEEMEVRKRIMPLGVPQRGSFFVNDGGKSDECLDLDCRGDTGLDDTGYNSFYTKESAERHAEMLIAWRKALVASAKGEVIDIEVLTPFLKKGWVAMDKDGKWFWYEKQPICALFRYEVSEKTDLYEALRAFNIKPAYDWKESVQECGLG